MSWAHFGAFARDRIAALGFERRCIRNNQIDANVADAEYRFHKSSFRASGSPRSNSVIAVMSGSICDAAY